MNSEVGRKRISSVVSINLTSLFPSSSFPPSFLLSPLLPHSHRQRSLKLSPGPLRKGHQNPSLPHHDFQTPSVLYCNRSGIFFYFMSVVGLSPLYTLMAFLCGKLSNQYRSITHTHTRVAIAAFYQLSWRNRCTATYSLPGNVSETTGNEIPAQPYSLPFVSEIHFLLGERSQATPIFILLFRSERKPKNKNGGGLGMRLVTGYYSLVPRPRGRREKWPGYKAKDTNTIM